MYAFRKSIQVHGAQMIETDVHLTADGEVVIFHDDHLERTTNGRGSVRGSKWFDLKSLDAGYQFSPTDDETYPFRNNGHRIPRLEDVLAEFPNTQFNIDLKARDPRLAMAVAEIITSMAAESRVCLGSEYDEIGEHLVDALRSISIKEGINGMYGRDYGWPEAIGHSLQSSIFHSGIRAGIGHRGCLDSVNAAGLWVNVWTIDQESEMRRLVNMGVGGIMTDARSPRRRARRITLGPAVLVRLASHRFEYP